jgi:acyl-CoA thioesterase-1
MRSDVAVFALAASALLGACDREAARPADSRPAEQPASPPAASRPAQRPALVFLGDSLTAGFGLGVDKAVPALIQGEVDRAKLDLRVVNAGRSGDTTAGGKSRVDYYLRPDVRPAALVVWLGANDVMRGLPVAQIEANLRAIVKRAREVDRDLEVFLVQMRAFPNMGADYAREFEAIYPRIAREEGAELLPFPMAAVAGKPELNQPDGIHPTAEGTRLVAAALWKALAPRLR